MHPILPWGIGESMENSKALTGSNVSKKRKMKKSVSEVFSADMEKLRTDFSEKISKSFDTLGRETNAQFDDIILPIQINSDTIRREIVEDKITDLIKNTESKLVKIDKLKITILEVATVFGMDDVYADIDISHLKRSIIQEFLSTLIEIKNGMNYDYADKEVWSQLFEKTCVIMDAIHKNKNTQYLYEFTNSIPFDGSNIPSDATITYTIDREKQEIRTKTEFKTTTVIDGSIPILSKLEHVGVI